MAYLRQGPADGWSAGRQVQGALDCPRAALWPQAWLCGDAGGLPRILSGAARRRLQRQHNQDRSGILARLSALPVRSHRAKHLDSASLTTTGQLAHQGSSAKAGRFGRHAAYQAVPDFGAIDRRTSWGDTGSDLGPRGLRSWNNRLPASWTNPDEQTPHHPAHEPTISRRARASLRRSLVQSCDRVRWQAGGIGQEGNPAAISQGEDSLLTAYPAPHLRGLDGARERADAENIAVSWPHITADDRAGLCAVLTVIYAGCRGSFGVLRYIGTHGNYGDDGLNHCFNWWALTGSNRRHSRCKQRVSAPNCQTCGAFPDYFANMCRFRFACVPAWCTQVHIGSMQRANAGTDPNHSERVRFSMAYQSLQHSCAHPQPAEGNA